MGWGVGFSYWRQEEKGIIEDEMVGWHSQLYGHEFEQAPGVGDGQGSLVCRSPWGLKESDATERLNWIELEEKGLTHPLLVASFLGPSPYNHQNMETDLLLSFLIVLSEKPFCMSFPFCGKKDHYVYWRQWMRSIQTCDSHLCLFKHPPSVFGHWDCILVWPQRLRETPPPREFPGAATSP